MRKASFILPPRIEQDCLGPCLENLLAQRWDNFEVLVFQDEKEGPGAGALPAQSSRVVPVRADCMAETLPVMLNRAISKSSGDVLFFVADCVEFLPGFKEKYVESLFEQPGPAWAYGRFHELTGDRAGCPREVLTDSCDFSEGSQVGPVRAIKKDFLETLGGYDEHLVYAFEYDLRLRMLEQGTAVRVEEPMYSVRPGTGSGSMRPEMEHFQCYVRSAGPSRARSYLDYGDSEEAEFRNACYRSLTRRGAFIDVAPRRLSCRHGSDREPSVTVIIPLWNREDYIEQALDSVLQSGDSGFEIVVVDNGSSDRSVAIVEECMSKGPVRLIHNAVNNIAGALNAGIRASRGKYVCQLDSDDRYAPGALDVLVRYMEANPDAALGVSYYDCIGPDGRLLADRGVVKHLEYDPNNLVRTDGLGHARIWHRCVLEELGGFDEENLGNYAEDYDLQLKLSEHYQVLRIPHVLYHYRLNHKKPGETIDYAGRHKKKTHARRAAVERRKLLNTMR